MRKKLMLWLGIFASIFILTAISVFLFLNSQIDKETKKKNTEFRNLIDFGKTEKRFETFVAYAAKTRFNEITFYRIGSSQPYVLDPKPIIPSKINGISLGEMSASDLDSIRRLISEIQKGEAVFTDPQDNPLMYSRPFFRVEFEEDLIIKIEEGNLG